jgi:hypothetical protein
MHLTMNICQVLSQLILKSQFLLHKNSGENEFIANFLLWAPLNII